LATALWERPEHLDRLHAEEFSRAVDDAARRRVVVDQVATLTDRGAIDWHARLIGPVDLRELGLWSSQSKPTVAHGFALPEPIEGL
jgi:dGTPase